MNRELIIALVLGAAAPISLVAQKQNDSVLTAAGVCRVWAMPPGGSNFPEDASYNRCALERAPVLRPDQPMPPQPRYLTSGFVSMLVVVNPDGTVDPRRTRFWSVGMDTAFNARVLETVHTWRFEPGVRGGTPVRSAFTMVIETGSRADTLPARLTWLDWDRTGMDTLRGVWIHESSLPPFTPNEVDSAFLAGGLGEHVSSPVTLCFARCARSYVLEPDRHTLAPSVRVRLADLREHTRTGDQMVLRILVDPPPENLMPVVIVRMNGQVGSSWADIARRTGANSWDYFVNRSGGYSPDAELLIYLVRLQ